MYLHHCNAIKHNHCIQLTAESVTPFAKKRKSRALSGGI
jgi:hypothetical protein